MCPLRKGEATAIEVHGEGGSTLMLGLVLIEGQHVSEETLKSLSLGNAK
jgi:hypothetical protein